MATHHQIVVISRSMPSSSADFVLFSSQVNLVDCGGVTGDSRDALTFITVTHSFPLFAIAGSGRRIIGSDHRLRGLPHPAPRPRRPHHFGPYHPCPFLRRSFIRHLLHTAIRPFAALPPFHSGSIASLCSAHLRWPCTVAMASSEFGLGASSRSHSCLGSPAPASSTCFGCSVAAVDCPGLFA